MSAEHVTGARDVRVLVTGGSGFIGTNLVEHYLGSGSEVLNVDLEPPRCSGHLSVWRRVDIRDMAAYAQAVREFEPNVFVHLAARTDLDEGGDYSANTLGVGNTLRSVERMTCLTRIVFTSTQLVCRPGYVPASDADVCPHTRYGQSKVEGERLVREWRKFPCDWVIARPTSIWGPWFDVPYISFFRAIARRYYFHQRGVRPKRTFGYVGNVIHQYKALIQSDSSRVAARTFYLGDYEALDIREWADLIAREMRVRPIRELPLTALKAAAKVGDLLNNFGVRKFPMSSFRLNNLTHSNVLDLRDTAAVAGALPFSTEEGVRRTIRWLASQS